MTVDLNAPSMFYEKDSDEEDSKVSTVERMLLSQNSEIATKAIKTEKSFVFVAS